MAAQQSGHIYGPNIVINGGNVHLGDKLGQENEDGRRKEKERLIESLRFREIYLRQNQISDCHAGTYQWYPAAGIQHWLESRENLFWVAGKLGSGKSTLMKFMALHPESVRLIREHFHKKSMPLISELFPLLDDVLSDDRSLFSESENDSSKRSRTPHLTLLHRSSRIADSDGSIIMDENEEVIVLCSFFWLNGLEMQRTLQGCLLTLLTQLLVQSGQAVRILSSSDKAMWKRSTDDWSTKELYDAFIQTLITCQKRTCIFLDGLDEFDPKSELRTLIDFVQELGAIDTVKVCVSSRQEPRFERAFGNHPMIKLQDLTIRDMERLAYDKLEAELCEADVGLLSTHDIHNLASRVAHRAEGVFLWALIVTRRLVHGIQNGDDLQILDARLQAMPKEMADLYEDMWLRLQNDEELYQTESITFLSLAEHLPLSLLDFTLAARQDLLEECLQNPESAEIGHLIISACETTRKRMFSRTGGLLELTNNKWQPVSVSPQSCARGIRNRMLSKSELCPCGKGEGHPAFPTRLWHNHDVFVQYVHRSVAEFISSGKLGKDSIAIDPETRKKTYKCLSLAQGVTFGLGCQCTWRTGERLLSRSLELVDESIISELVLRIQAFNHRHAVHVRSTVSCKCKHADAPQGHDRPQEGFWIKPTTALDIVGLMCALGCLEFLQLWFKSLIRPASPLYLSYLLNCATQRHWDFSARDPRITHRARVVLWLLQNGADLTSYYIDCIDFYNGLFRRPVLGACWLFVLQLLIEHDEELELRLSLARGIADKLSKPSENCAKQIIWTTSTHGFASDLGIYPVVHVSGKRQLFSALLKSYVFELRDYVLQCVSDIRTNLETRSAKALTKETMTYSVIRSDLPGTEQQSRFGSPIKATAAEQDSHLTQRLARIIAVASPPLGKSFGRYLWVRVPRRDRNLDLAMSSTIREQLNNRLGDEPVQSRVIQTLMYRVDNLLKTGAGSSFLEDFASDLSPSSVAWRPYFWEEMDLVPPDVFRPVAREGLVQTWQASWLARA